MKVSVVIPAYNERSGLELTLRSLGHNHVDPAHDLEVVIVDDGSTDGTGDMIAELQCPFELRYVFKPRGADSGRSAARNTGVRAATGDVVIMIDADQIPAPGLVQNHLRHHELRSDLVLLGTRLTVATGPVDRDLVAQGRVAEALPPVSRRDSREGALMQFAENLDDLATAWHYLYTYNVSVRREHLLAVDGFDEGFDGWGLEDTEMGFRLRQRGLAFAYEPAAAVYCMRGQAITESMYVDWRRNLDHFSRKHDSPEVHAQGILERTMNPASRDLDWKECMWRFEHAVRALQGRPSLATTPYELVEIDEANLGETLATIGARATRADLLVIDATPGFALQAHLHSLNSAREILYFQRPSAEYRLRILASHNLESHNLASPRDAAPHPSALSA